LHCASGLLWAGQSKVAGFCRRVALWVAFDPVAALINGNPRWRGKDGMASERTQARSSASKQRGIAGR